MVFVVIDYATRKVEIAGIAEAAYGDWMVQMARNLTDPFCGFLKDKKYLIHDRDVFYTQPFTQTLKAGGVKPIKSMPLAPNFSPFVERFIRSIKSECLDRMIILGEAHLRYVISEYVQHYHTERAHQGLDNNLIEPPAARRCRNCPSGAFGRAAEVLPEGCLMAGMTFWKVLTGSPSASKSDLGQTDDGVRCRPATVSPPLPLSGHPQPGYRLQLPSYRRQFASQTGRNIMPVFMFWTPPLHKYPTRFTPPKNRCASRNGYNGVQSGAMKLRFPLAFAAEYRPL